MKNNIYKLVILTSLLFMAAACSSNNTVKEREQEWEQKVAQFKPIGKTKAELFEWQKNNNVPLNSFPDKNGIILETIEGDGLVCSRWHVYLSIESDTNGIITAYSISSAGTCL